jgi:hypothetical protein
VSLAVGKPLGNVGVRRQEPGGVELLNETLHKWDCKRREPAFLSSTILFENQIMVKANLCHILRMG